MRYRLKYLLFTFLCIFAIPLITHAECDYQRQAELSRLASNVQLSYVYSNNTFIITMTNLTSDLYVTDNYGQVYYGDGKDKTFEFYSGTINFDIYSNEAGCRGQRLLRKTVSLPALNIFAFYPECNQYPEFKYCQNWGNFSLTSEQFYSEFNKYKQQATEERVTAEENKTGVFEMILDVLEANKYMLIFLGSVVILTVIVWLVKKKLHK